MRWSFINSEADMKWLREVHKVDLYCTAAAAAIHGNEDSPDRIDLYENQDPKFTDKCITLLRTDNGNYQSTHNQEQSNG